MPPHHHRRRARLSHAAGRAPGVLPAHDHDAPPARISAVHYDEHRAEAHCQLAPDQARALADQPGVTWIDVDGLADTATVEALGRAFGLHPLLVEDLVTPVQRPKLETYDEDGGPAHVFVVARPVRALSPPASESPEHAGGQIGMVLGPGWVLSVSEGSGAMFEPLRERIQSGAGRIRGAGADYLLYSLLDVVVDGAFGTLEQIEDAVEDLEAQAIDDPSPAVQQAINRLRRETVDVRRALWPLREVLASMMRDDLPYVEDRTQPYLRDTHDHLVQAVEILEALRESLGSLFDLYLSALGTRQNEVMRVLTVVGTLFLPLGFLTGLYGMNFDVMPELHWRYGYFVLLGLMAALSAGTLLYFRRKGWL